MLYTLRSGPSDFYSTNKDTKAQESYFPIKSSTVEGFLISSILRLPRANNAIVVKSVPSLNPSISHRRLKAGGASLSSR